MTRKIHDEIVEEIRRRREEHAKSFDYDLKRISQELQRLERASGATVVTRAPKKPRRTAKQPLA